ncbi:hypothetical protein TGDOM2_401580, partial [Toxoplasma gondii GAB2-2007-GAL-DOM2]
VCSSFVCDDCYRRSLHHVCVSHHVRFLGCVCVSHVSRVRNRYIDRVWDSTVTHGVVLQASMFTAVSSLDSFLRHIRRGRFWLCVGTMCVARQTLPQANVNHVVPARVVHGFTLALTVIGSSPERVYHRGVCQMTEAKDAGRHQEASVVQAHVVAAVEGDLESVVVGADE